MRLNTGKKKVNILNENLVDVKERERLHEFGNIATIEYKVTTCKIGKCGNLCVTSLN